MQIVKLFFKGIGALIKFINTYFKTFVFLFIIFLIFMPKNGDNSSLNSPNLTRIDLKGEILNVDEVLEKIIKAKNDKNIKGVLFVIDSPGGAFAPSMELALAIKNLKEKKPVVAYASGTMASGSYLSGVSANKIISNPASFIGSIGVIMQGADISELAQKIGIKEQVVKAGEYKQAGTFSRPWSEKEREYLQNLVSRSYTVFTNFVAKERKLNINKINDWANAQVFLAVDALNLKLIDELGSYEYAKKELEKMSKVKNPVWEKEDKLDKFLDKLSISSSSFISKIISNALKGINLNTF